MPLSHRASFYKMCSEIHISCSHLLMEFALWKHSCGRMLPEVTLLEVDLSYPEHPIKILDQKDRVTRRKTIKLFKI
jgi:hypothetical protein